MKKLLALVLTLVMTMSLMTVGSSAAAFDDDASISYKEAVEVLNLAGILAGDGTGNFNPNGALTRAAAAKLVTYAMVGADAAEGLTVSAAPFSDVPADHWAAGYIGYLVSEGVVAGIGDGKFDPNGEVTALQLAKMLLIALGYDASIEKLVGDDWSIATSKLASKKKIFKGNDSVKVNATATREEAALYVFNALNRTYVTYDSKGSTVVVGSDVSVTTGASSAEENKDGLNGTAQLLREDLYEDLKPTTTPADAFGRPATEWKYKSTKVGPFADDAVLTLTTEATANEALDAIEAAGYVLDDSQDNDGYDVNITWVVNDKNGTANTTLTPAQVETMLTQYAKTDLTWTGKGIINELFADDDDTINRIVTTYAYLGEVSSKTEDKVGTKTTDERKLMIDANSLTYSVEADDDVKGFDEVFAAVEEGDMVVIKLHGSTVIGMYVPTAVTGDVSYYKAASSLTVGGTNYPMSTTYTGSVVGGDEDVTLYIDECGYAIGSDGGSSTADSLVVLNVYSGLTADGAITDMALVLYADGTTERVVIGTMAGYTVTNPSEGQAYLYDENDDDEICFANVPTATGTYDDNNEGETYAATITVTESAKSIALGTGRNYLASDAKLIYVSQDSNNNWKFTVSDKLQDLTNVPVAAVIDADGNISTLYILGTAAKNTVKDGSALIFIADNDGVVTTLNKDGKSTTVNQYDAFIDGVKIEGFITEDTAVLGAFYENEYDTENGWYVLSGNGYNDASEDIKVTGKEFFDKDTLAANKYITVDNGVDVELTSTTKYASNDDEYEISSLAELKAEVSDQGSYADIYVVYDDETGVALYVYITDIVG